MEMGVFFLKKKPASPTISCSTLIVRFFVFRLLPAFRILGVGSLVFRHFLHMVFDVKQEYTDGAFLKSSQLFSLTFLCFLSLKPYLHTSNQLLGRRTESLKILSRDINLSQCLILCVGLRQKNCTTYPWERRKKSWMQFRFLPKLQKFFCPQRYLTLFFE